MHVFILCSSTHEMPVLRVLQLTTLIASLTCAFFLYDVTFYLLYFTFARSFLFSAFQFVLQTGKVKFHSFI